VANVAHLVKEELDSSHISHEVVSVGDRQLRLVVRRHQCGLGDPSKGLQPQASAGLEWLCKMIHDDRGIATNQVALGSPTSWPEQRTARGWRTAGGVALAGRCAVLGDCVA
jgi:hypothetical protein